MPTNKSRIFSFTLIEVVVVVAILSLTAALASTRFGGESPSRLLDNALTEFEGFCGRVRYRAVEEGLDWVVRYNAETRRFTAIRQMRRETKVRRSSEDARTVDTEESLEEEEANSRPDDNGEDEENATPSRFASDATAKLVWVLPEKVTFSVPDEEEEKEPEESEEAVENGMELFRFFPDGACAGDTLLIFHSGETLAKTLSISKLTGRMITKDGDATINPEESDSGSVTKQKAGYAENI